MKKIVDESSSKDYDLWKLDYPKEYDYEDDDDDSLDPDDEFMLIKTTLNKR